MNQINQVIPPEQVRIASPYIPQLNSEELTHPIEAALLLSCTRITLDALSLERIKSLTQHAINWDYLVILTSNQSVLPLLHYNIKKTVPDIVPKDAMVIMQMDCYRNLIRHRSLSESLCDLMAFFTLHEVRAIPYKGPTPAL